ncbi:MAG: ABC transporter ATP-binding protein, partial [Alphaproteobacteria bacterium]|nr:ABC transporter ATP-binding protein [Alphaproteobacteria bacterium]
MADHSIRATLGKVFALFDAATRRQVRRLFAWMLLGATLEMVGTALLVLFLDVVANPAAVPQRMGRVYAAIAPGSPNRFILLFGIAIAVLFVVKNTLIATVIYRQNQFAQQKQADFSAALLANYLDRPYSFHLNHNSAFLLNKIVTATPLLFLGALLPFLELTLEVLRSVGTLAVLFATDFWATLGTAVILGGLALGFFGTIQGRLVAWGAAMTLGFGRCYQAVNQGLGSVKEIKVLGREAYFVERFHRASLDTAVYRVREGTVSQLPQLFLEAIVVAGLVLVIVVLLQATHSLDQMAPILSVFALAAFRLIPSMNKIVGCATQIKAAAVAVDEVAAELGRSAVQYGGKAAPPRPTRFTFTDKLEIEGLGYSYPGARGQALSGVDLTLKRGESVALVGSSGAGKTTLADVMLGVLQPTSGRILVDGVDVLQDMRGWQSKIGYVPQSIYLTDDTLRRNIALGLPDELIDEAKLADAIKLAHLDAVIAQLPAGLDEMVGEHGVRLSGGQRQRVGIARALYHRPEVLVLDEATSALDNVLEREVSQAIATLGGQITMMIIAHRLSTARKCDRVVL